MRRKILIAGFTGAGKSSLGEALKSSNQADWYFSDLDQVILRDHGKKNNQLSSLIEEVGWEKFRLWERQAFESLIKTEEREIITLGGGTLSPLLWELYGSSRSLLFCHLSVPFEIAWSRIMTDGPNSRPLIKLGKIELQQIYEKRMEIFRQIPWQLDGTLPVSTLTRLFWEKVN
jgi:shikimate kinase